MRQHTNPDFYFFMTARFAPFLLSLFLLSACTTAGDVHDSFQRDATKPVLFEEFSDFQCPYCKQFHPVIEKLKGDFPNIEFRYAYFPLENIHPYALGAAEAAECVRRNESPEIFKKYIAKLFASADLQESALKSMAKEVGADEAKCSACISSKEAQSRVKADTKEGFKRGVDSTPTIFINGQKYTGDRSYEDLYQKLKSIQG